MPDFFAGGMPRDLESKPTEERMQKFQEFTAEGNVGHAPTVIAAINSVAASIGSKYPSVQKIGAFGMCYGGKVLIQAAIQPGTAIQASAQGHPSRLSAEDAKGLKTPHLILASKDESAEDVSAFDKVQKPLGSETHTYPTMHHGWMGARAKLDDDDNAKEFKNA